MPAFAGMTNPDKIDSCPYPASSDSFSPSRHSIPQQETSSINMNISSTIIKKLETPKFFYSEKQIPLKIAAFCILIINIKRIIILNETIKNSGFDFLLRQKKDVNDSIFKALNFLLTQRSDISIILYKFLSQHPRYLATHLSSTQKLDIQITHYTVVKNHFANAFFQNNILTGATIWENHDHDHDLVHAIVLKTPDKHAPEGEFLLQYQINGYSLHKMTFTITTGYSVGIRDTRSILIGGSQGAQGTARHTRQAVKLNNEVLPANILIIAIQALATALKMESIAGISSHWQCSACVHNDPKEHYSTYDHLWESNGGEFNGHFYIMPSRMIEKPICPASRSHRARSKKKRNQEKYFYEYFCNQWRQLLSL